MAANTRDGNYATRWSSDVSGTMITYDLGSSNTIGSIKIAWYNGVGRHNTFSVQSSADGSSWKTLLDRVQSSGTTADLESYTLPSACARYVRVVGYGNDTVWSRAWTSLTEFQAYGTATTTTPTPAPTTPDYRNLDDPRWKATALALTSTVENSTTDWTTVYSYIEDIGDGRGYTGGIVGFCSGTGDMLTLVQYANTIQPGNILAKWIPKLQQIMAASYSQRPAPSHSLLGSAYLNDWSAAASTFWFQKAQRDGRDRVYWNPAFVEAKKDGVTALGLAIYYDISVNHGPGSDSESFGGILATARSKAKTPALGGDEATYLRTLITARDNVLRSWGDYQTNGRSSIFTYLLNNNPRLALPLKWSVYGDSFSLSAYPTQ